MKLVLFLGAGFSKGAKFPLMREFSMFSQNLNGYEDHILCFHKCIEYAQRTRAYIQGDIYNVEYLMSVLSLAAITNPILEFTFKGKKIKVAKALEILKQLVWRVYSRIDNVSNLTDIYKLFIQSLKYFVDENNSIDIITTNYDLLPEMMMHTLGQKATMPVKFECLPLEKGYNAPPMCASISIPGRGEKIYEQSDSKNLHKLHGSINWFIKRNSHSQPVYCWDETFPPQRRDKDCLFYTPFAVCKDAAIPEDYLPVIVPPSMIKEYKVPVILKAWQDASDAIAKADKILFVGYSFPPSDTIMKFFLGTSLTNNHSGCPITIIDKNTDALKSSLQEVFVNDIWNRIVLINTEFQKLIGGYFHSDRRFADYLSNK